ncbi:LamG domain-containing protein [Streptacidiphilus sp. 4-A2]|nr:LamG domain-containing protein [Streptacidiphilus sp. 4-A2]
MPTPVSSTPPAATRSPSGPSSTVASAAPATTRSWASVTRPGCAVASTSSIPAPTRAGPWSRPARTTRTPPRTTTRAATATAGTWYHLVGTYNATTGTMSLYVNGTLAGTATNSSPWAAGGPLLIGAEDGGSTPGTVASFPGEISDVQAFDYALTPNQVGALYQQIQ